MTLQDIDMCKAEYEVPSAGPKIHAEIRMSTTVIGMNCAQSQPDNTTGTSVFVTTMSQHELNVYSSNTVYTQTVHSKINSSMYVVYLSVPGGTKCMASVVKAARLQYYGLQ